MTSKHNTEGFLFFYLSYFHLEGFLSVFFTPRRLSLRYFLFQEVFVSSAFTFYPKKFTPRQLLLATLLNVDFQTELFRYVCI